MTTRTFNQQGQAYGSNPVQLAVKLDQVVVFNGTIPTLDIPVPDPSTVDTVSNLFSWTNDVSFAGTKSMEITVTGGTLILTQTLANYGISNTSPPAPPPGEKAPTTYVSTGPDGYTYIYWKWLYDINLVPEKDNVPVVDPLVEVVINQVPQYAAPTPDTNGQWYWVIPDGGTFTAIVQVQAGVEVT